MFLNVEECVVVYWFIIFCLFRNICHVFLDFKMMEFVLVINCVCRAWYVAGWYFRREMVDFWICGKGYLARWWSVVECFWMDRKRIFVSF